MKNGIIIMFAVMLLVVSSHAQQTKDTTSQRQSIVGYLVDHMCGKMMAKGNPEKIEAKAARHTRECGLEDGCKANGYGLVSGKKYFKLDSEGDTKAEEYLRQTKKEDNIKVEIGGRISADTIFVKSIRDFKPVPVK